MADRIDDLLEQAIETGTIPPEATSAERAEVERLLAGRAMLRAARDAAHAEAAAAKPTARARFERFTTEQQATAAAAKGRTPVPAPGPRSRFGRFAVVVTGMRGVAVAAAIGLVAVVALFAAQNLRNTTEAAAAFEAGDYVQLQGTVSRVGPGVLTLRYELGTVTVELGEATTVVAGGVAVAPGTLKAGDTVLVGGVAGDGGNVSARTLAVSAAQLPAPAKVAVRRLDSFEGKLPGRVVAFALTPAGRGRVTLETADRQRVLVIIDPRSAERLVELGAVIGRSVTVAGVSPGAGGMYFLEFEGVPPPSARPATGVRPTLTPANGTPVTPPNRPSVASTPPATGLVRVTGVLTEHEGLVLRVTTDGGPVRVQLRADTRILVGESGITLREWLAGATGAGHLVTVSGGIDARSGLVVADLVLLGPKP
ncbi:MAG: hypothetical protein IT302_16380 [Dehalococcoidia bacterium]|nr:hypothetical protein [Dehalococcoidia bacterium]